MSLADNPTGTRDAPKRSLTLSIRSIGNLSLGLVVFLSGFVFFEPAPYELLIVPLLVIWFACGLTLRRSFLPLTLFLLCFVCGGAIASTQKADIGSGFFYIVITGFLATTSIFYAALICDRPQERLKIVFKAYSAAAIVAALIGVLAYLNFLPNSESYLFGGRARGPFKDPNVYGPFLILPAIVLLRHILLTPVTRSLWQIIGLLIILAAIFLAFSRAAWGMTFFCMIMMVALIYITANTNALRGKIFLMSVFVGFGVIGLLLFALSFDAVSSLFEERAKLVQSYDGARFGRFARYSYGLTWIMETPLGFGFGKFRATFGEDTHNIYIKAFLVYGWLGGISYLLLVGTTLAVGFKQLFKAHPWQGYMQACYVVILGHVLVGLVVDIDRWRHLYLIYGLTWGMIAADAALKSRSNNRKPGSKTG